MIETFSIKKNYRFIGLVSILGTVLLIVLSYLWFLTTPPKNFPVNSAITIPRGLPASSIVDLLKEKSVVRSGVMLYAILLTQHDPETIQAGVFIYDQPLSVWNIAKRLTSTSSTDNLVSLTLPEGFTAKEFSVLASKNLPDFEEEKFRQLTATNEGYLFPDTYYLPGDFTASELVELQLDTYAQKIAPLKTQMLAHEFGEYGVLILASLIEREANTPDSMRIVSGILQKRLADNMRLQVDASLEYILNRPLHTLTANDLKRDNPYNTYLYAGLPPTPIGNPGIQAINAVLNPIESDYLYYLTDADGTFHYAKTFDEHKLNIAKYLK